MVSACGAAQGMTLTEGYLWNRDDESRKFGKRFFARTGRNAEYDPRHLFAVLQYLKAVQKAGTDDTEAVAGTSRNAGRTTSSAAAAVAQPAA